MRTAAYLTILFGLFGVLAGVLASSTFYYFEGKADYANSATAPLTVIAGAGALICVIAAVAGWGLLRSKAWAWNWSMATSFASVASVAALISFWPTRWGFLVAVAAAYTVVVVLLLVGHTAYAARTRVPSAG